MKLKKVVFTSLVTLLLSVPTAEVVSNSVQAAEVTSSSTQTASDSSTQTFQVPTNGISFQNRPKSLFLHDMDAFPNQALTAH